MATPTGGIAHRPAVMGRRGAVASAHPLSTLAGLMMLQQGGNAVDAAVAMAAALNVVEPYMSGAAGVGYMVITVPGASAPLVLDYIGRAPAAASPDQFADEESKDWGIRSPLVPGALGGWLMALERFGRLDRAAVFAPAIEWAEHGFPLTINNSRTFGLMAPRLSRFATTSSTYLPGGEAPPPGAVLRQTDLARTFRTIVDGGGEAFYRGPIAAEIVRFSQANGGLLTADDLATYVPTWVEPISTGYRGYTVFCPPLPCSGMQYLETLNLVEGFDMAGMGHNSADSIHTLAEAMKLSLADRTTYAPDPTSPIEYLLSPGYSTERRALIDPRRAGYSGGDRFTSTKHANEVLPGNVERALRESTTHFVAADLEGYVVATTQTLGAPFGSAVVHGDTGLVLNNFAHWFDLDPASPNVIAPNKQVEMCLAPSQIWRDGKPYLLVGTPGSFGIMETTPQMMMNVIDHGFSIQAAIEAARFRTATGTELLMESRVAPEVVEELTRRGHDVKLQDPFTMLFGGGQGIVIDPESGAFSAGADPRRDGYALAH
ncbi:MAG TPA: gamma-glutamyltransferase family protein [Thermomicrobiaceae bacterium]|nr:gamma-glutamyltransferase family protein [Thermomicrobiaceae bacterium]